MPTIVDANTSSVLNANGTRTISVGAGPRWYQNDSAIWTPVVFGSDDEIAGNCEMVPIAGGYRIWRPNGLPPYNPDWLPTDYWLDVTDGNGVATNATRRTTITERVTLANAGSTRPAWRWRWNSNLTHQMNGTTHEWVSADGQVQFRKFAPQAWSVAAPEKIVTGTATMDADGFVTVTIDLSGLSYPIVMDPTTSFNSTTGDGTVLFTSVNPQTWADTVNAANGTGASNGGTSNTNFAAITLDAGASFTCVRGFTAFNLSAIPSSSTVTAASTSMFPPSGEGNLVNADTSTAHIVSATQASTTTLVVGDYDNVGGTSLASIALSAIVQDQYNVWAFNATGVAAVQGAIGGFFKCAQRNSRDIAVATPTGDNRIVTQWSEGANTPTMSVTYSGTNRPGISGRLLMGIP